MNAKKLYPYVRPFVNALSYNSVFRIRNKTSLLKFFLTSVGIHYKLFISRPVFAKAEKPKENEVLELSKSEYYDRVLGNNVDYFFLIIYDESKDDTKEKALRAAKMLKAVADENNYLNHNIYLITRQTLNNIRQIIGRATETNLFESNTIHPIEIYIKTPHSNDFMFLKFNARSFFTSRKHKKIRKIIEKVHRLVEVVKNEEELYELFYTCGQKLGNTLILMSVDEDTDKEQERVLLENYRKLAFFCFERKLTSRNTKFLLIKSKKMSQKYKLSQQEWYVLRHDVVNAYEKIYSEEVLSKSSSLEIANSDISNFKYYLDKKSNNLSSVKQFVNNDENEKWNKEVLQFVDFVLPRILLLDSVKFTSFGQFIRKSAKDKGKSVVSLYCPKFDPNREQKLKTFMELYKKHNEKFLFVVVEHKILQDFFPHINSEYPAFVLFNFFSQYRSYPDFGGYYKSLTYPYKKHFLSTSSTVINLDEIEEKVQVFLNSHTPEKFLNSTEGYVQSLKGSEIEEAIKLSKERNRPVLIGIQEKLADNDQLSKAMRELGEENTITRNLLFYAKADTHNARRYFGEGITGSLVVYNPRNDEMLLFPMSKASKAEEIKGDIQRLVSEII